jgi:dehydrogenase/reductase SDR family protein 4
MSLKNRFENKIAVVTASSTGIGLAIVKRLAKEGAIVIISSRNQKNVNEAVEIIKKEGGKAEGFVCDASKSEDRKNLIKFTVDKYGGIDILVPNAAIASRLGSFLGTTES